MLKCLIQRKIQILILRNPFNALKYLPHYLRKKFNDKYIIIESDDWGMERALNQDSVKWMEKKYGKERLSRWSYDSLETPEDLNELYNVLKKYRFKFEFPPVITANFITHNVDYTSREKLSFIPLSKGFNNENKELEEKYSEGIKGELIYPQLHGYSHFNLKALEEYFYTNEGRESFENKFLAARSTVKGNLSFLHGELSIKNPENRKLIEASEEFRKYFGFYSKSIIPPTFIFDNELAGILKESRISLVQSSNRLETSEDKRLNIPYFRKSKGLYWSIRNARLDPDENYKFYHDQCISSIENAFNNKIPAIIDFHRVNFAGTYAPEYRTSTIKELDLLLDKIYKKWPGAKFIHTQKLNDILWQQETR